MEAGTKRFLAVSLAGHDKGQLYLVLEEKDGVCLLTDGKRKLIGNPKRKKTIHIQKIIHIPGSLKEMTENAQTDAQVRAVLKMYLNRKTNTDQTAAE